MKQGSAHLVVLVLLALVCGGCAASMRASPTHLIVQGEYGRARVQIARHMTEDRSDRQYLLDRMKLVIMTLADGYPAGAQLTFEQVYDVLRTQGINADKTVASVVLNEDVKFWKGEPFEQALALAYYSAQQAQLGYWDNARAAAGNALFRLRDFREPGDVEPINTHDIVRRAIAYEEGRTLAEDEGYLNTGYAVRESNFTLGYLLNAVASQQLGRADEANDNYTVAAQISPDIVPLIERLRGGDYDTLLLVSYGLGPRKIAYGPDNALARFTPRTLSDDAHVLVSVAGQRAEAFPVVCDINHMAADHMWNNLEDVRLAKSHIGSLLLTAGAITTGLGANNDSDAAVYAGLGMMAAGLFSKAGARADTRYCDALPQRLYLVPVNLTQPGAPVEVAIEGRPGTGIVLTGLAPPRDGQAQLRYVRLVSGVDAPPAWASSGRIVHGNDVTGPADDRPLPYILGGHDVRTPSHLVVGDYHRAGHLRELTLADLNELYRAEGIATAIEDTDGRAGQHVLEGGRSLVGPMGGTAGFARLFCQPHPPYTPRSDEVRNLITPRETLP